VASFARVRSRPDQEHTSAPQPPSFNSSPRAANIYPAFIIDTEASRFTRSYKTTTKLNVPSSYQTPMTSNSSNHPLPHHPAQSRLIMSHIEDSQPTTLEGTYSSSERTSQIRIKNRRKLYLDRHPSYFTSPDLELAGISFYFISIPPSPSRSKTSQLTDNRSITIRPLYPTLPNRRRARSGRKSKRLLWHP
jgi:hypothetical protein